ncbi:hypothetical protein PIB30_074620 [Stylosanthes scabra]|uniref:RRM domain-containing protein n=1 Tax=Stylosanthes scabra TaxID=79078 RepID=A0ABU6QQX5_9FABA|nr:hypothetical protein [Stylosanthes scabra]
MKGVSGALSVECGKHGEVSGFAEGRHKGESGGGFAPGVWRNINRGVNTRTGVEEKTIVFVDNLPANVTKRELYKKLRMKAKGLFAFIRFQRFGGALRLIRRLNGTLWKGGNLFITMSKFKRSDGTNE